ncbi:hypothetical protein LFZ31_17140 [Salmonella enterica subsp. enterica serovar Newport str. S09097]|nr:hypothetical protein LFZ31_17140 [Salmonella enterica subsp. enterica serovar Newport str. S09097]
MTNGMIYLAFTLLWVTSLFRRQIPVVPDGNRVAIAPILITVETNERSQMLYGMLGAHKNDTGNMWVLKMTLAGKI